MDLGSFFYAADGTLRVRPFGEEAHDARGHEWREAGLALNPSLGDPALTRFASLLCTGLLQPPEDR
jgi:hypothetical protein